MIRILAVFCVLLIVGGCSSLSNERLSKAAKVEPGPDSELKVNLGKPAVTPPYRNPAEAVNPYESGQGVNPDKAMGVHGTWRF